MAIAFAAATGADDDLRGEILLLAMEVERHLERRGQPGAWTRIDLAAFSEELPARGEARRLQLLRLGELLDWMAEERLIPLVRSFDYGVEIARLAALPDRPLTEAR
jgi:hypothetical protein